MMIQIKKTFIAEGFSQVFSCLNLRGNQQDLDGFSQNTDTNGLFLINTAKMPFLCMQVCSSAGYFYVVFFLFIKKSTLPGIDSLKALSGKCFNKFTDQEAIMIHFHGINALA